MQFKNIECHNFSCEDRKWLGEVIDKNKELQVRNDNLNKQLKDMEKTVETEEVKYEDKRVQEVMLENIKLRRDVGSKGAETERQRKELIMKDTEIKTLQQQVKDIEEREVKDVFEFRKTEEDKKGLLNEIKELELKRKNLEITNATLNSFKTDMMDFLKDGKNEVKELENRTATLSSEIKKRLKYLSKVDKKLFKVLGFRSALLARKLNKAIKLVNKGKKDKAKKLLAKLRMKIINLEGRDKEILVMKLEEVEGKI